MMTPSDIDLLNLISMPGAEVYIDRLVVGGRELRSGYLHRVQGASDGVLRWSRQLQPIGNNLAAGDALIAVAAIAAIER